MAKHDWNSASNHIAVMRRVIDTYSYLFNYEHEYVIPYGCSSEVPANELQIEEFSDKIRAFGVFFIEPAEDKHPRIRVHIDKILETRKLGGVVESKTSTYALHVGMSFASNPKESYIFRFDNGHSYEGHATSHHFHFELTSDEPHVQNKPFPVHVGEHFPHVGDLFELVTDFRNHANPFNHHKKILGRFGSLNSLDRRDKNLWLPKVSWEALGKILSEFCKI